MLFRCHERSTTNIYFCHLTFLDRIVFFTTYSVSFLMRQSFCWEWSTLFVLYKDIFFNFLNQFWGLFPIPKAARWTFFLKMISKSWCVSVKLFYGPTGSKQFLAITFLTFTRKVKTTFVLWSSTFAIMFLTFSKFSAQKSTYLWSFDSMLVLNWFCLFHPFRHDCDEW